MTQHDRSNPQPLGTDDCPRQKTWIGNTTERRCCLTDTLEMLWLTLEETPDLSEASVSELPDHALLTLADSKMNESQNQRLGDLQAKGKAQ